MATITDVGRGATPLSILETRVHKPLTKLPVFPGSSDVATFAAIPPFTKTMHRIAKTPYFHAEKMLNGVGRGAIRRLARVTAMDTITAPLSNRTAAADRSLEASAPGHRDGTIRSPASYPTRAMERQSSEVWCQLAGARKSWG